MACPQKLLSFSPAIKIQAETKQVDMYAVVMYAWTNTLKIQKQLLYISRKYCSIPYTNSHDFHCDIKIQAPTTMQVYILYVAYSRCLSPIAADTWPGSPGSLQKPPAPSLPLSGCWHGLSHKALCTGSPAGATPLKTKRRITSVTHITGFE